MIVTRRFEDQEELLTLRDLEAMWACMAEFEGLAFTPSVARSVPDSTPSLTEAAEQTLEYSCAQMGSARR